jgi:predicted nucleotidyltransferase
MQEMKSFEEIKKFLQENKEIILKEFKAEIVGIFGSYARGEQTRESDIDIVVRFREGATLFDLVELAEFLEHKLGIKVDIVSERAVRPELKESIFKEIVAT